MIIDSFIFGKDFKENQSLDILESHLKNLDKLVDYFVIYDIYPHFFKTHKKRFEKYISKIVNIHSALQDEKSEAQSIIAGLFTLKVHKEDILLFSEYNQILDIKKLIRGIGFLTSYLVFEVEDKIFSTNKPTQVRRNGTILLKGLQYSKNPEIPFIGFNGKGEDAIATILRLKEQTPADRLVKDGGYCYV